MYNYKKGKNKYTPNELGSLYVDSNKLNPNERPIIYIGGQMEHRLHKLEQTGLTQDPGHNMFTGNWFYEYPIRSTNKSEINGENFAKNFSEALKMANLGDVDVITNSYGGTIAALASKDGRIHHIYATHPSLVTGTPLANPNELEKYATTKKDKLILEALKSIVDTDYGFQKDNYVGVDLSKVDLNKLTVIGSSLDPENSKGLPLDLYNLIKRAKELENDGVVIFDENLFRKLGINYEREKKDFNHFESCSKEALNNASDIIKKR